MTYAQYDAEFWYSVAYQLHVEHDIHMDTDDGLMDPQTLYTLARALDLGCDDEGNCYLGSGGWDAVYTADRLHRRLGLR